MKLSHYAVAAFTCSLFSTLCTGAPTTPPASTNVVALQQAETGSRDKPIYDFDTEPLEDAELDESRRSIEEADRLDSKSLYAHARLLLRHGKTADALRRFQRSWQMTPDSQVCLDQIVALAFTQKRYAEAARYANLNQSAEETNKLVLRRLAYFVTKQNDYVNALKLYERILAVTPNHRDASIIAIRKEMGRLYQEADNHKKAAESFTVVMEAIDAPKEYGLNEPLIRLILENAAKTYGSMGETFLKAGENEKALTAFRKAYGKDKVEPQYILRQARVATAKSDFKQAKDLFDRYLGQFGNDLDTNVFTAYLAFSQAELGEDNGRDATNTRFLELWGEAVDKPVTLGYALANSLMQRKKYQAAKGLLKEVQTEDSLFDPTLLLLLHIEQEQVGEWLGVVNDLSNNYRTFDRLNGFSTDAVDSEEFTTKLLSSEQIKEVKDSRTLLTLALVCLKLEKFEQAIEFGKRALQDDDLKSPDVMVGWGLELLWSEQTAPAAELFADAIKRDVLPDNRAGLYYYLAGAHIYDKNYQQGIEAAQKVAELAPQNPQLASRLAWSYYLARDFEKANKEYQRLIAKFDSELSTPAQREIMRSARLTLSNIAIELDDNPMAEEWLLQVLDEYPRDIGAMNDLGYLWADQNKRLQRSLVMIKAAVEAEPENQAYRDSLGWVHFRLGNYEEAIAELEKAVGDGEDADGVILEHLGDAYGKAGQKAAAEKVWKKAIDSYEHNELPDKADGVREKIKQLSATEAK